MAFIFFVLRAVCASERPGPTVPTPPSQLHKSMLGVVRGQQNNRGCLILVSAMHPQTFFVLERVLGPHAGIWCARRNAAFCMRSTELLQCFRARLTRRSVYSAVYKVATLTEDGFKRTAVSRASSDPPCYTPALYPVLKSCFRHLPLPSSPSPVLSPFLRLPSLFPPPT